MTRLYGVISVCAAAVLGTAMVGAGCSSSSSPAAPVLDAGTEASVTATPDGASPDGAPTTITVQWMVVDAYSGGDDGGATEAGALDAGDAGTIDAGADAGADADVDAGDGATPSAADGGADAATVVDASDTDGMSLTNLPPLPGVQVCVYQNDAIPCVTTQADGTFTLPGLPVRSDLVLTLKKDGYESYLLPIETASTDTDERSNPVFMTRPSPQPPAIGVPVDFTNKGVIDAFAVIISGADMNVFTPTMGTSVTISPTTANGPYYLGDNGPVLDAGTFQGSTALFYNVDPGTYTLTYANPDFDCEPISFPFGGFGFPVTTPPHSVKVVVAAGYVTGIVGVLCTPNPKVVAVDGG
jgi:hypothetical protein